MTAPSNRGVTPNQQPQPRHNQHPQLRLPLSHHGLPRAPTSPSSSFSSRSNRYEALSPHNSASSTSTTPTFIPHAGPKHQHNLSIASSSSASTRTNTMAATGADASQRAASFFRCSHAGDAPPSPPMTPFSPSAFPSEASTPMVLSPALPPPPLSDDSTTHCCAHCCHCGGSVSEPADSQQQRSRSVEDVPCPMRRHASTRSLKHADSAAQLPLMGAAKQAKRQQEQSCSREGSKGADRGRAPRAKGSDGPCGSETDASTYVGAESDDLKQGQGHAAGQALPPSSSSSSSSFSRMGKRIKAVLGGPKKGVRSTGPDLAAERKIAKRKERERLAFVEVEEVGDVHWTEM